MRGRRGLSGLLLHDFLHYSFLIASAAADFAGFINPQQGVYLGDFNPEGTVTGCDPPNGEDVLKSDCWDDC